MKRNLENDSCHIERLILCLKTGHFLNAFDACVANLHYGMCASAS